MSEEEAIKICKNIIRSINGDTCYINYSKEQDKEAIETLLDLYNKQKEEIERFKNAEEYAKLGKETLLDAIHKQEKEIEQLANGIRVLGTNPDITTEEIIKEFTEKPISEEYMEEFKSRYISKDKIIAKIALLKKSKKWYLNGEKQYFSTFDMINSKIDLLKELLGD